MDTRPLRVLLTANMAVFLVVCMVLLVHHLGAGIVPDDVGAWLEGNQWLMWTAVALTVGGALATQLPSRTTQQSGEDE